MIVAIVPNVRPQNRPGDQGADQASAAYTASNDTPMAVAARNLDRAKQRSAEKR